MEWRSRDWRDVRLWILGVFVAEAACFADFSRHLYPTWDDGNNLRLLDSFLAGDWSEFYHHASPAFFLLMLPLRALGAGPMSITALNMQFHIWGLFLACRYGGQALGLGHGMRFWCFLALVLSPISQFTGHSFTLEPVGMFFLWLGLIMLWQRRPLVAGFAIGLACAANYKLLLILPLVASVAWLYRRNRELLPAQSVVISLSAFVGVMILACIPAFALDLDPLEYPKRLAAVVLRMGVNPDSAGQSSLDVLFYFRYLLEWDNSLWLFGLIAAGYSLFSRRLAADSESYGNEALARRLLLLTAAWILVFTFLPKAPRALYPLLPALPLLTVLAAARTNRTLVGVVAPLMMALSLGQCIRNFFPFGTRAYQEAAGHLATLSSPAVGPRSMQLYPWLPPGHRTRLKPQASCGPEGRVPVLLDDPYRFATGCTADYDGSEDYSDELSSIGSPILWLEHCEFTGQTYARTLERRRNRRKAPLRILLNAGPAQEE